MGTSGERTRSQQWVGRPGFESGSRYPGSIETAPRGAIKYLIYRYGAFGFARSSAVRGFVVAHLVRTVYGDRYAGEWPRERFRAHRITYEPSAKVRSDLYRDLLPRLNAGTVELLDHPHLIAQLIGLKRRVARSGRETIDHGPSGRDDVANAVAGVADLAGQPKRHPQIFL